MNDLCQAILYIDINHIMRKLAFCMCENKGADQLHGYREADQHLCFHYIGSTIPLLFKPQFSNLKPSSVVVQPGLYWTWSETSKTVFSGCSSYGVS